MPFVVSSSRNNASQRLALNHRACFEMFYFPIHAGLFSTRSYFLLSSLVVSGFPFSCQCLQILFFSSQVSWSVWGNVHVLYFFLLQFWCGSPQGVLHFCFVKYSASLSKLRPVFSGIFRLILSSSVWSLSKSIFLLCCFCVMVWLTVAITGAWSEAEIVTGFNRNVVPEYFFFQMKASRGTDLVYFGRWISKLVFQLISRYIQLSVLFSKVCGF